MIKFMIQMLGKFEKIFSVCVRIIVTTEFKQIAWKTYFVLKILRLNLYFLNTVSLVFSNIS